MSAKKTGSTITISVVSDDKGHFSFPASKIGPGDYNLRIRAIGYDLEGPAAVTVPRGKAAAVDLKLRPVDDISSQMTPAEWIASAPGTAAAVSACAVVERAPASSAQIAARWLLPEPSGPASSMVRFGQSGQLSTSASPAVLAGPSRKLSRLRLSACGSANAS